jgi:hypothetical protein
MKYMIWRSQIREGFCVIGEPNVDDIWELEDGVSRIENFPPDAACKMSARFPKDIDLQDSVPGAGLTVISEKVKQVLERLVIGHIEYLPVRILNHKGRVASKSYYILNPLDVVDCIDLDASVVEWNEINTDRISYCKSLVLKPESIPESVTVFRPKYWTANILVRDDVTKALDSAGVTGLLFLDPATYKGIG